MVFKMKPRKYRDKEFPGMVRAVDQEIKRKKEA
jgi:hypothetical protein